MKFNILRDEFYEALQRVVSVIPQRSTITMTQNILFSARGNTLELTTTDLEITMISSVTADVETEGSLAVPGRLIHDIVRELPNVSLTFESESNFRSQLRSEFGQYKIGGENPAEFPQQPAINTVQEITLPNDVLKRLIEKTIFACSRDELRPALTGVFFEVGDNRIQTVATDGHRLAMIDYENDALPGDEYKAIISTRALNFVLRSMTPEGVTVLTFGDKHARIYMDSTQLYARLIEEAYVDYNRVIPAETNYEMKIDTSSFLSSVKRVSLFSNPINAQVVLNLESDRVQIHAEDMDYGGEAREEISCEYNGEPFTIGFNSRYLQDMLRHVDAPQVVLHLVRPDFAVIAKPGDIPDHESQLMLLMPIRLENV